MRQPDLEKLKGKTFVAQLRKGYLMVVGDDVVYGRAEITLTPKALWDNFHKIENTNEANDFLGLERAPNRLSAEEEMKKKRIGQTDTMRDLVNAIIPGVVESLVPAISAATAAAVKTALQELRDESKDENDEKPKRGRTRRVSEESGL